MDQTIASMENEIIELKDELRGHPGSYFFVKA